MATVLKILGQINPTLNTLSSLYVVPINTSTVISTLTVCNLSLTVDSTFRLAIRQNGAAINNNQYIYYDLPILANDTFCASLGLTLAANDVISIYSSTSNLSFNLFGQENS